MAWKTKSENHSNSIIELELNGALEIFAEIKEENKDQSALYRLKPEGDIDARCDGRNWEEERGHEIRMSR